MSGKEKDRDAKLQKRSLLSSLIGTPLDNFKTVFGGDKRSYALFRIFLGLVVVWDLINRMPDVYAHYSDAGVMPRQLVLSYFHNDLWITLHMMSGLWWVQLILFGLHGLMAFSMTIGYYTQTSTFLTWLMTLSLHNRNIIVLHGGDILQRVLLFFAIFLPLGDCYSIDSAYLSKKNQLGRKSRLITPNYYRTVSVATLAISIQIGLMYVTSYLHKTGSEWTTLRTSTWLALQLDYFRTPIGDMFLWFPGFLKLMTASVLWWEGYGPVFWYLPIFSGPARLFGAFGFWAMHLGFGLCLRLGQFGPCGMTGVLSLIPTFFWEDIVFRKLRTRERLNFKYYYNPYNSFSTKLAIFISNFLLLPETHVSVMPNENSNPERYNNNKMEQDDDYRSNKKDEEIVVDIKPTRTFAPINSTWLLVQDYRGTYHSDYEALVQICKVSPLLWPLTYLLRNKHISRYSRKIVSLIPSYFSTQANNVAPQPHASSRPAAQQMVRQFFKLFNLLAANIFVLISLLFVLGWNAGNIGWHNYTVPPSTRWFGWFLHIDQSWGMFSPRPPNVQWYYVIEGELENGKHVGIWNNGGMFKFEPMEVEWERPQPFSSSMGNHRWFKFYENGINSHPKNDELRLHWGRYICREYNAKYFGSDRLYKFSIHWMNERANPDEPRVMNPKQTLWNHVCYDRKR